MWEIEQRDIVIPLWLLIVQLVGIVYNVMTTRSVHNITGYIEMTGERIACGWEGRYINSADKWRCALSRCNVYWTQRLNSR